MAGVEDFLDGIAEGSAPAQSGIDSFLGGGKQNTSLLQDLGTDVKRGVQQLPGIATGLADVVVGAITGERLVSRAADTLADATGFTPGKWAEEAEAEYSPQRRQAVQEIEQAWEEGGAGNIAGAYARNPGRVVGLAAESLPGMVAGGLAGRAALGVGRATGILSKPATAAQAGRQAVAAGAGGEGAVIAGSTMDEIDDSVDARRAAVASLGAGVVGAGLGYAGGRVAQRFGLIDPEAAIAGGTAGATRPSPGLVRRMLGGAMTEGAFEELPQSAQETMWQNWAEGRPLMENVPRAAVEGALAGGVMGAGANVLGRGRQQDAAPETDTEGQGEIAGFLPAPVSTGTPSEQILQAQVERQNAVAAAEARGEDIRRQRAEYEAQRMGINAADGPISKAAVESIKALPAPVFAGQQGESVEALLARVERENAAVEAEARTQQLYRERDQVERSRPRQLMPFNEAGAQRIAQRWTQERGEAYAVVPHPTVAGRFAVVPAAQAGGDQTADIWPVESAEAAPEQEVAGGAPGDLTAALPLAPVEGERINRNWSAFTPESGTLGVPRAEMPQIRSEHRGAMVNFMNARGIAHEQAEVPADSLRPTQAEFSPKKVRKASKRTDGDRSILVSSDGYVLDGHHQWLAKREAGEPIKIIRLNAPIADLLPLALEFPSSTTSAGAAPTQEQGNGRATDAESNAAVAAPSRAQAGSDMDGSRGDLAQQPDDAAADAVQPDAGEAVAGVRQDQPARSEDGGAAVAAEEFIPAPDGSIDYGEITTEMGTAMRRQAGPMRLQIGKHDERTNRGWGLAHIEARHGKQIRALGYESIPAFVSEVAGAVQEVWQADGRQILVTVNDGRKDVMYIQLEPSDAGDYYRINSAFPVRQQDYEERQGMVKLWPVSEPQAAASGEPPAFVAERADKASGTDPNAETQSDATVAQPAAAGNRAPTGGGTPLDRAIPILMANTDGNGSPDGLTGPENADARTQIVSILTGESVADIEAAPNYKFRTGVTQVERALYDAAGIPAGNLRDRRAAFLDWLDAREGTAPPADQGRIEDFGEKIGGARKDVWQSYGDRLKEAGSLDLMAEPLSKSWPAPDYEKLLEAGADPWAVAFMHAARDAVPAKPRMRYKLRAWAQTVGGLRDVAASLADGSIDVARAKELLSGMAERSRGIAEIEGRIELYEAVGHAKSLADVRLDRGEYSLFEGVQYDPPKVIWSVEKSPAATSLSNWPRMLATGNTKAQAIESFKGRFASLMDAPAAAKEVSFDIYSERGKPGYFVGKKIGRNYARLAGPFNSLKEARAYKADSNAELVERLAKFKEIPNERRTTNEPRVGEDMRGGQDVTPQLFSDAFGFRGVEFGNYVERGRRQQDLNDAYDALMDMAAVIGVPPKALSLNGELGLAFGARGKGAAGRRAGASTPKAHYEAGFVVINLTKGDGAGSLGHEWWHALDNYFSRRDGDRGGFMTEPAGRPGDGVREEMRKAFNGVVSAINRTRIAARSSVLDARRAKAYWTTGSEMSARAFESYLITKLQDQGVSNDYLANIVDEATWEAAAAMGFEQDGSYPYPTAGEVPAIRAAFDEFFAAIQTRETDRGVELFSRATTVEDMRAGEMLERLRDEAGQSLTSADLKASVAEAVPGLERHIDTLLERGRRGEKGGVVIVDGADAASIEREYRRVTGRPLSATLRVVAESRSQVPLAFYQPQTGVTFLIGPMLNRDTAASVLLHETYHSQQRASLDAAALRMIEGRASAPARERALLDRVAARMESVGEAGNASEAAAYIIEEAVRSGKTAGFQQADSRFVSWVESTFGKGVAALVRRFIMSVRAWSVRNGLSLGAISVDDLVGYAMAGVERAAQGDVRTSGLSGLGRGVESTDGQAAEQSDAGARGREANPSAGPTLGVRNRILAEAQARTDRADSGDASPRLSRDTPPDEEQFSRAARPSPFAFAGSTASAISERADRLYQQATGQQRPDPSDPFAAENARLREQDQTLWAKAKKQLRRYLTPGGLLPQIVFDQKIERDSNFQAVEFDVRHIVGGFEQAVKNDYGKAFDKLTEAEQRMLSNALAGAVPAGIKDDTKAAVVAMRQYIDTLSGEYLNILQSRIDALMLRAQESNRDGDRAAAINEIELYEKIRGNIGAYVHRSYQAFDDPNWFKKVSTVTLNSARKYLADGYMEDRKVGEQEAYRRAEVVLNEILKNGTAYDSMESFVAEGKLGAKDLSVLMRRKDVPPVIRALLGEYTDPRLNFTKSATKMGRLIWNQRFLDRVREIGMGTFLFEGDDRPPSATSQIAADGSEAYAPLNGLWTFPEVTQAFKDALGKDQMSDLYRFIIRANGMVKYGKTVLSPTTAMRNWQSAMFFTLANGHFDLTQMKKSVSAFREQVRQSATGDDLAYLRHLKELGVVYDTPYAGEMMRYIEDARADDGVETVMRAFGASEGAVQKGLRGVKQLNQIAQGFYTFGDDFWKIIGFENEKAGLLAAGMSVQEAEREAAKRIRNTYPTYSMVGSGVRWLSRFPLMGTFVSFPAEIIRNSGNMLRITASDLKSDNPAIRRLGMRRAVGMAMVSGMFYGLAALSKAMLGVDDDEEEALRDLAPPWQKNSTFLFAGRDDNGNLRYFDLSFLDPYGYWKRPLTAMMRDQPWEDSAMSAVSDMLSPFFGTDIATGAIFEVLANKKGTGGKVFSENADVSDQAADIANHLRKALQPGFAGNVERLTMAMQGIRRQGSGQPYDLQDEMVALLGWRSSTMDPKTALYYRSFEFNDAMSEARQGLNRVLRSANDVSQQDIADAKAEARRRQVEAYTEMRRLVESARAAGMNPIQIRQVLGQSSISQANIQALMRGTPPPFQVTSQAMTKAVRQAQAMEGPEFAREVARRFKEAAAAPVE